jgi:dolichyl-phosphate beta-glucosyltransferase
VAKPFLSIVIPAHNEERRLPGSLEKINCFLAGQAYAAEVIVVENGSTDNTANVVRMLQPGYPYLRLIEEKKRGKGLAVRIGMLAAQGDYCFQADADLSMPIEEVTKFLPPVLEDCQVVIASRELPGARRIDEPAYRHAIGRGFNALVRVLTLPGLQDTQCGFKCFRADVTQRIFPLQKLNGMSFDAEVLVIARRHGFTIQEVPINWYFNSDSRVKLFKDSFRMALDLFTIRRNARLGMYDPR